MNKPVQEDVVKIVKREPDKIIKTNNTKKAKKKVNKNPLKENILKKIKAKKAKGIIKINTAKTIAKAAARVIKKSNKDISTLTIQFLTNRFHPNLMADMIFSPFTTTEAIAYFIIKEKKAAKAKRTTNNRINNPLAKGEDKTMEIKSN